MAERVFALFENATEARRVLRALRPADFRSEDLTICSTEPLLDPDFFPPEQQKSRMSEFAIAGGLLGLLAGYFLPSVTAQLMDLPVGGQPNVSLWAFAVVIFELTALGAIGGTFIALLIETGLPRLRSKIIHEEWAADLTEGGVLIGIHTTQPARLEMAQRILQEAGGKKMKVL